MKKSEWNEGLNHIDNDLVVNYIEQKELLQEKKKKRALWLRACAIAACLAIIMTAAFTVPMLFGRDSGDLTGDETQFSDIIGEKPFPPFNDGYSQPTNTDSSDLATDNDDYIKQHNKRGSILSAWTGRLSTERLKYAIAVYSKYYTNIVFKEDTDFKVSFDVDFEIAECSVVRVSCVNAVNIYFELGEGLNFSLDAYFDNKTVNVPILEYGSTMEKYPIVSYLISVKDVSGEEHFYYFRANYSNLKNTSNQGASNYKLEISKPNDVSIENELKESYLSGEVVTVKLKPISGYYEFYVNGVIKSYDKMTSDYVLYTFVMPSKDVTVEIKTWYSVPSAPSVSESAIEITVEDDVIYFKQLKSTAAVLQLDEGDVIIEDDTFIEKLGAAINGKNVIKCECNTNYYVEIDRNYFHFHSHGIEISVISEESTSTNGSMVGSSVSYTAYSVDCSEEEMNELVAILESAR